MKKVKIGFLALIVSHATFAQLPEGFVYLDSLIANIQVEMRYCTDNNFVGNAIDGYVNEKIILTEQAAQALIKIQNALNKKNLGLKIYDAYRPQQAVNHFMRWAKRLNDTVMKYQFYPNVEKRNLFKDEYIATRSRHSSGSTVDITIVDLTTNKELDMGSPYDFFGQESWVNYDGITEKQKANRQLLQTVMQPYFTNYPKEWWHFTLRNEPFRNKYFNFFVE